MPFKDRAKRREYKRQIYKKRKTEGLCRDCNKTSLLGHIFCEEHLLRQNLRTHIRYQKRKSVGLCHDCNNKVLRGYARCPDCLLRIRNSHHSLCQKSYSDSNCPICRNAIADSPHHITPRSEGGKDLKLNIVYLCKSCHDIVEEIYSDEGIIYSPNLVKRIQLAYNFNPPLDALQSPTVPLKVKNHRSLSQGGKIMEDLEQMNWGKCITNLNDAIKYLQECRENLEKALRNIYEAKQAQAG